MLIDLLSIVYRGNIVVKLFITCFVINCLSLALDPDEAVTFLESIKEKVHTHVHVVDLFSTTVIIIFTG